MRQTTETNKYIVIYTSIIKKTTIYSQFLFVDFPKTLTKPAFYD